MKVLLIGSYPGDGLRSMERFERMLAERLKAEGIETEIIRPPVMLGGGNKWLGYLDKFVLFPLALRRAVRAHPGWLVHIVDQGNAMYGRWLPRYVVTCHDLLAIRAARGEFSEYRPSPSGRVLQWMILRGLRKAGGIACVSTATQKDCARLVGESEVIANGLDDFWHPVEARESGYLLHAGGDSWYKNRAQVVRTFLELRKRGYALKLVLAGLKLGDALCAELDEAGCASEVSVRTDVSDEDLRALYSGASALLFPSLAEGFGWPVIEAQACGCPVVSTNCEPLRETGGSAALYAEPGKWTEAVVQILEMDAAQRAQLVAAGIENAARFPVKKMARAYAAFYNRTQEKWDTPSSI